MPRTIQMCEHEQTFTGKRTRRIREGTAPHSQRGLTLVEALITLLVMTIGLLGIAAMQVIGVQENASAFRHSQATWLVYDMADRMRANSNPAALDPGDASAGPEDIADHYKGIDVRSDNVPPAADGAACDGAGENCGLQEMADFDAFHWWQLVQRLPGAKGTVTEPDPDSGRYLVRVMWDESEREIRSETADTAALEFNVQGCPSDMTIPQTCVEIWVEP